MPLNAVEQVYRTINPHNILFFTISNFAKLDLNNTTSFLGKKLEKSKKYIVANSVVEMKFLKKNNIVLINNIQKFLKLLSI